MDPIETLRTIELFKSLKPQALERVAAIASEETHTRGTTIFRQGDVGDKLYIILEGQVRISRQIAGMGEEALAIFGPGQVFGEMALIDESPRSADALVHESCRLLVISKDGFDDLLFGDKELAYEVLWSTVKMLVDRLRATSDKVTLLGISSKFG